jgi:hypothetical protein
MILGMCLSEDCVLDMELRSTSLEIIGNITIISDTFLKKKGIHHKLSVISVMNHRSTSCSFVTFKVLEICTRYDTSSALAVIHSQQSF